MTLQQQADAMLAIWQAARVASPEQRMKLIEKHHDTYRTAATACLQDRDKARGTRSCAASIQQADNP